MGALSYIPELYIGKEKALPELDHLQKMALDVLSEKTDKDADVLYFNSGNSGGCRPKTLYNDDMLFVGEGISVPIPRKRGQDIIDQVKKGCKEILSDRFKS